MNTTNTDIYTVDGPVTAEVHRIRRWAAIDIIAVRPEDDGPQKWPPTPRRGPDKRDEPGSTVQLRAGESTYRLAVDLQGRTDVGAVATADHFR